MYLHTDLTNSLQRTPKFKTIQDYQRPKEGFLRLYKFLKYYLFTYWLGPACSLHPFCFAPPPPPPSYYVPELLQVNESLIHIKSCFSYFTFIFIQRCKLFCIVKYKLKPKKKWFPCVVDSESSHIYVILTPKVMIVHSYENVTLSVFWS